MNKHIVVIGGGVAGIEAAGTLADLGQKVSVIEKHVELGDTLPAGMHCFLTGARPVR